MNYFDRIENIVIEYHLADSKPELGKKLITKIKNTGFKITTRPHHNDMGFLIARKWWVYFKFFSQVSDKNWVNSK